VSLSHSNYQIEGHKYSDVDHLCVSFRELVPSPFLLIYFQLLILWEFVSIVFRSKRIAVV